jgi:hypothetical protein
MNEINEIEIEIRTGIQAGDGQIIGSGSATGGAGDDTGTFGGGAGKSGGLIGSGT